MLLIMVMMILNMIVIAQHVIITLEEGNREAKTRNADPMIRQTVILAALCLCL